ncbi:butyrophilin subfamily 1 member A1-like [Carassius auratus]|uniref:Butyrophilin subfamily 1 member A1-like n=1 Tax=Carassius auratus TaxID=7957 RepID=A0A6P6NH04_CARAU|nr:butyrophilin subfamily 1 member A1-like [Carassius auratus]
MMSIIITLLMNLFIETSVSLTVLVPGDPVVAHVGSTVILPCWISPAQNAEALEIRWYRHDQFNNPVLLYNQGKIQYIQECFRDRSSLTLRSDQSGGLKDGDVSLHLEKLTFQDEGLFLCYVSGDREYDSKEVALSITESSGTWKAHFVSVLIVLVCLILGLVGFILYKYRDKLTGKKPGEESCEEEKAVDVTIDRQRVCPNLTVSQDGKSVKHAPDYKHTGEAFPYKLCAFGAQRFSSGRHYWEVELAVPPNPSKNYWLIGVTKEGNVILRDRYALTPLNGFWFLYSKGPNGFHTNTNPPVKLPLTPRPERLGVLLNYYEGQLSFYNVKERKHLLTIKTKFPGSVRPLFSPGAGDQSEIRILDCTKPAEPAADSSQPLLKKSGAV